MKLISWFSSYESKEIQEIKPSLCDENLRWLSSFWACSKQGPLILTVARPDWKAILQKGCPGVFPWCGLGLCGGGRQASVQFSCFIRLPLSSPNPAHSGFILQENLLILWISWLAALIPSVTLIPPCRVEWHIHRSWGLGRAYLWGAVILPVTGWPQR